MNKQEKIKFFDKCVRHYFFNVFHLHRYELFISQDKNDHDLAMATTYWNSIESGDSNVSICYDRKWIEQKDLTKKVIDEVAFHEVCEALLMELSQLIICRFIAEKDIPNAVHRVIRTLENTIYHKVKLVK